MRAGASDIFASARPKRKRPFAASEADGQGIPVAGSEFAIGEQPRTSIASGLYRVRICDARLNFFAIAVHRQPMLPRQEDDRREFRGRRAWYIKR